ncbi:MAG: trehalose-6-phosphate synthase [Caldilineales bacterium]|nr:trehalose-6-phosphate synthase [Caldilineales bacterium]
MDDTTSERQNCRSLQESFFANRTLIIAANRGPITFQTAEDGSRTFSRGSGGLVTALMGLAEHVDTTWIACARTEADVAWEQGEMKMGGGKRPIHLRFLAPTTESYDGYYNVIANPLLWFLQHSMWDVPRKPVIDRTTWKAWEQGYVAINQLFAEAIVEETRQSQQRPLVMLQDYHLYLVGRMVRSRLPPARRPTLLHFVHIPWPGADYWSILPPVMRTAILEGLLGVDVLGFQTHDDALNFMRTCQRYLSRASVKYNRRRVWYRNHATQVHAFPISIDAQAVTRLAASSQVQSLRKELEEMLGDQNLVLRIERIEPSKNIVRGFRAFEELLELYPEHRERVTFLAILVPSRMDLREYRNYLDEVMAAVGRINATYGHAKWEPVRVLLGESYQRAVAAMQRYDVLLVNSIADGMNLVAKEGPVVNKRYGQLVLSERTGAREQLEAGSLVIAPCDIYATAEALQAALTMPDEERRNRAAFLRQQVEREDITWWLCRQLQAVAAL